MQAAVLLEKLTIFDEELDMRNKVSDYYRKYLNNAQHIPDNYHSAHALFSITLGSHKKREELADKLRKNNIPNVIYYKYPIHLMKGFHYLGYKDGDFPISENLSQTIVSLPMHPYLSEIDIDSIIEVLQKYAHKHAAADSSFETAQKAPHLLEPGFNRGKFYRLLML